MAATVSEQRRQSEVKMSLWDIVIQETRMAQEKNTDPFLWAVQITSTLNSSTVCMPSIELAHILVSYVCWDNHAPLTWKFLEKALAMDLAPPVLVLALLSTSVIQNRHIHPAAYRLYMELLRRYAFSLVSLVRNPNYHRIMESVDEVLQLSVVSGLEHREPGLVLLEFLFLTVSLLLEASLRDEGLLEQTSQQNSIVFAWPENLYIGGHNSFGDKKLQQNESLLNANTAVAIEIIVEFLQNRKTSRIISMARENMPSFWGAFILQLQHLVANSMTLKILTDLPQTLLSVLSGAYMVLSPRSRRISKQGFHLVDIPGAQKSCSSQGCDPNWSALWLPVDLFLVDCLAKSQVGAICPAQILSGLVKSLQVINGMTWHDTFLGLWIAALRLVRRVRGCDHTKVTASYTVSCLSILLSITVLAVANIIEEEELQPSEAELSFTKNENDAHGKCHMGLLTCLQLLGDYKDLLVPPRCISLEADQAAAKAVLFISGLVADNDHFVSASMNELPLGCSGNMLHLIVEACIARKLLDTSAYFWPGYVNAQRNRVQPSIPSQMPRWSSLMHGSPLTPPLVNELVATPASSLGEIEKIYEIALNGSNEDKISAATILCGASLHRGWSIQVHLLAGAVMPICEVFGSCVPGALITLASGENISFHEVFSNAFTLLLRLWKFYLPHPQHVMGDAWPLLPQLSPQYILSVRNTVVSSYGETLRKRVRHSRVSKLVTYPKEPITMDSLPKLRRWYEQVKKCMSASSSGMVAGCPVHQVVDALMTMMFRRIICRHPFAPNSMASNVVSPVNDALVKLEIPAWDILEAIPFVLDAALTACAHGRLSPRELTTGLKDLADFLPASLAAIVCYFSAEVRRSTWKPASMNGTDWPTPAANLFLIEKQIERILAATGVDVPNLAIDVDSPLTLPLPLAALVSFTITYKLDKSSERYLQVVAPALKTLACSCPWPSMPITCSLWAQKMKRWNDFFVYYTSSTVFHHNNDAVAQLLRTCFQATLGFSNICGSGGVSALLGQGLDYDVTGGIGSVSPGILFLTIHTFIRDVVFVAREIVSLLMVSVGDIMSGGLPKEQMDKLKKATYGMRYGQVSVAASLARLDVAALLGASLIWISGGSNLVQTLIREIIPSWFSSAHELEQDQVGESRNLLAILRGHLLAYFTVLCVSFAWGVDTALPSSRIRPKILTLHFEFLANALKGRVPLRCDSITWQAYVRCFLNLLVNGIPLWIKEIDAGALRKLSEGLKQLDEEELALALLGLGGTSTIGAAVEMIIASGH